MYATYLKLRIRIAKFTNVSKQHGMKKHIVSGRLGVVLHGALYDLFLLYGRCFEVNFT